jgi:hypothetical protein
MTFSKQHRELGEIIRELEIVREQNLKLAETHGRWMPGCLLFAEGLLVLLALERFLRVVLGADANDGDTLPNLLEKATSTRLELLTLPPWWTRAETIGAIKKVRNALMHGNYEQAAIQSGRGSREEYFRSSAYINEVETLHRILDGLCNQIDPATGKPRDPRPPWPDPQPVRSS